MRKSKVAGIGERMLAGIIEHPARSRDHTFAVISTRKELHGSRQGRCWEARLGGRKACAAGEGGGKGKMGGGSHLEREQLVTRKGGHGGALIGRRGGVTRTGHGPYPVSSQGSESL